MKYRPGRCQINSAGYVIALQLHVREHKFAKRAIVAEIQHVLKSRETEVLRACRIEQRGIQGDFLSGYVLGPYVNFTSNPAPCDKRPYRDIRDV